MSNWVDASNSERNPKWDYKKDKTIEGVIVHKSLDITVKNLCFYDIEVGKDKKLSVLGNTVINRVLRGLPLGTLVRITYLGEATTKTGASFNNFKIEYDADTVSEEEQVF